MHAACPLLEMELQAVEVQLPASAVGVRQLLSRQHSSFGGTSPAHSGADGGSGELLLTTAEAQKVEFGPDDSW